MFGDPNLQNNYMEDMAGLFYETVWQLTSWDTAFSDELWNAMNVCRGLDNFEVYGILCEGDKILKFVLSEFTG